MQGRPAQPLTFACDEYSVSAQCALCTGARHRHYTCAHSDMRTTVRTQTKHAMGNTRDPVLRQQLNIKQQALKITANSM